MKRRFRNFGARGSLSVRHVHKITGGDLIGYEVTPCTGITRSRLPLRLAAYWPSSGWGPLLALFVWSAGLVRGRVKLPPWKLPFLKNRNPHNYVAIKDLQGARRPWSPTASQKRIIMEEAKLPVYAPRDLTMA